jgi:predicted TIM-barrel fold metal-dependent hydrolase
VTQAPGLDVIETYEQGLFRALAEPSGSPAAEIDPEAAEDLVIAASRARNATATLENMRRSLDEAGIETTVCLPVPPYLTFDDLLAAQRRDAAIVPFTGVDFGREADAGAALARDVERGARGLKLHPIIQREPLDSRRTFEAVEAFAPHGLPILFHSGSASYHLAEDRATRQIPELGRLEYGRKLVAAFPDVPFIAGHAGLLEVEEAIALLGGCENVHVDTSFQSPESIRRLIDVFGRERVLFASDWPFGRRPPALASAREACSGDAELERLVLHRNAARLLRLPT